MDEYEERILLLLDKIDRDIATHGMSVIGVMGDPPFSYTIGLWSAGHPELIICGMEAVQAHGVLTSARIAMTENGLQVEEGLEAGGVLVGYAVRFKEVPEPRAPLNVARRFHKSDRFPAFQLLWPDEQGRFPDEEGYDAPSQDLPEEDDE